jgi:hypothetical protein
MPAYDHENEWMRQVSTDCIWSDPASEDMEGECFPCLGASYRWVCSSVGFCPAPV